MQDIVYTVTNQRETQVNQIKRKIIALMKHAVSKPNNYPDVVKYYK